MIDYSKWNDLSDSEDEGDVITSTKNTLSPELTNRLQQMNSEDPSALDKLDREIEEAKLNALAQLKRGATNQTQLERNKGDTSSNLAEQGKVMREQIAAMEKQRKEMDDQIRRLEQLASVGDESSVLKFFQEQGMGHNDVQRMIGGDSKDADEVLTSTAQKATADANPELTTQSEKALKLVDELEVALKDEPPAGAEGNAQSDLPGPPSQPTVGDEVNGNVGGALAAHGKTKKKKGGPAAGTRTVIPEVQQRVVAAATPEREKKKEGGANAGGGGGATAVAAAGKRLVMEITMPLLTKASDAELDVAPRAFKLKAKPPPPPPPPPPLSHNGNSHQRREAGVCGGSGGAEQRHQEEEEQEEAEAANERVEYLLSTELVETVDPARVSAKWSKKTKCLTVTLPLARG